MSNAKPLQSHLPRPKTPSEQSEALRRGTAVGRLMEHEGWQVLMESIQVRLHHEQKDLMMRKTRSEDEQVGYERIIGQWAGMERVEKIAEGIVRLGDEAKTKLEEQGA